jgi:hypothetical protein
MLQVLRMEYESIACNIFDHRLQHHGLWGIFEFLFLIKIQKLSQQKFFSDSIKNKRIFKD